MTGNETKRAGGASRVLGLPGAASNWTRRIFKLPRGLIASLVIIVLFLAMAAVGPQLIAHDPFQQHLLSRNVGPSSDFWFGTDNYGRDVFARLIHGARLTLAVGLGGTVTALFLGAFIGLAALATGRWIAVPVFGVIDFIRSLPDVLFALILVVAVGPGLSSVTLALGVSFAPYFAYVARAAWKREMAADYVIAAKTLGASRWRILYRHALPNVIGALVTLAAVILPRCVVTESVLSFLGLGASPDTPTWGRMISDATPLFERAPHAAIVPVFALSIVTLALALLANHVRALVDPLRSGTQERKRA
ncbi:ABC transporter permease [Phyllobacterium zundukense]|nr:ABC transporter permease [Phyllobacterium zundukense]